MDTKQAIEVLQTTGDDWEQEEAALMGAQALEAWAWVERHGATPEGCGDQWQVYTGQGYGEGSTPLAAVLDAMEKEGKP